MNETLKSIANSYAEELCSDAIYPAHLFKAILHKEMGLVHFIETDLGKDYFYLQDWADIQMQLAPRSARPLRDLSLSEESEAVLSEALNYRDKFGLQDCTAECVLASLADEEVYVINEQGRRSSLGVLSRLAAPTKRVEVLE